MTDRPSPDRGRRLRAVLAVSTYRYDEAVLTLLEGARKDAALELFERVLVVDSIGTGRMPAELAARFGSQVQYHAADRNLGSAGNLALRLQLAADAGADVVYAVNHDGSVERATVTRLFQAACELGATSATPRFGALFPLRRLTHRQGRYDLTGRWSFPVPSRLHAEKPREPLLEVYWSSSNPALYALAPVREGLTPWGDLWMGWEDLGYGWLLHRHGLKQYVVTDAVTDDGYELRPVAGSSVYISDKPAWYAYYAARNLVLVTKRVRPGPLRALAVASRIALEAGDTVVARRDKRARLSYLAHGVADGLRGRTGKWRLP